MTKDINKVNANESEIASHWREEELIYPSDEFAAQANINDKTKKKMLRLVTEETILRI